LKEIARHGVGVDREVLDMPCLGLPIEDHSICNLHNYSYVYAKLRLSDQTDRRIIGI